MGGEEASERGLTTRRIERLLEEALREPPPEAVTAAMGGRVYLLDDELDLWLVKGEHGDYIVVRGLYCSCPWFTSRVLTGEARRLCYHIIAVELAARGKGRYKRLEGLPTRDVILEAVLDGFSRTLRLYESRATGGSSRARLA